jgi:hypothetical protein
VTQPSTLPRAPTVSELKVLMAINLLKYFLKQLFSEKENKTPNLQTTDFQFDDWDSQTVDTLRDCRVYVKLQCSDRWKKSVHKH